MTKPKKNKENKSLNCYSLRSLIRLDKCICVTLPHDYVCWNKLQKGDYVECAFEGPLLTLKKLEVTE